jgi:hypothetical protein
MNTLIRNAMRTPDGTIIESRHRHDYVTHRDANGVEYMVDGGLDYVRRSMHVGHPAEDLTVYLEDGHDKVREALTWGTYGKNGDQPLRQVKLSEMSNAHIQACLDNVPRMYPQFRTAMETELAYRAENNILIED